MSEKLIQAVSWGTFFKDGDVHVIPVQMDGMPEEPHIPSMRCRCLPRAIEQVNKGNIVVHFLEN